MYSNLRRPIAIRSCVSRLKAKAVHSWNWKGIVKQVKEKGGPELYSNRSFSIIWPIFSLKKTILKPCPAIEDDSAFRFDN